MFDFENLEVYKKATWIFNEETHNLWAVFGFEQLEDENPADFGLEKEPSVLASFGMAVDNNLVPYPRR